MLAAFCACARNIQSTVFLSLLERPGACRSRKGLPTACRALAARRIPERGPFVRADTSAGAVQSIIGDGDDAILSKRRGASRASAREARRGRMRVGAFFRNRYGGVGRTSGGVDASNWQVLRRIWAQETDDCVDVGRCKMRCFEAKLRRKSCAQDYKQGGRAKGRSRGRPRREGRTRRAGRGANSLARHLFVIVLVILPQLP